MSKKAESELHPQDHGESVALFRAEVIGALGRQELERGELAEQLRQLSHKSFRLPGADLTRSFSVPTLERWLYAYRHGGLEALRPKPRSDKGPGRALTVEQRELLCDIRREHPSAGVPLILRTLCQDGRLAKDVISESGLRRLYQAQGLDRQSLRTAEGGHTRLRWQAERPGALWHADVCHGPNLLIQGSARPLRIHALLDDASRYIVAIDAYHTEREADMLELYVRALRCYGGPDVLYLDNGSTYRGQSLRLCCERLGTTLLHAAPYDPQARGKMERFWRSLRQGCLDHLGSLSSLHEVQVRLFAFVDQHYHNAPHAGLMGVCPGQVFAQGMDNRLRDPDRLLSEQQAAPGPDGPGAPPRQPGQRGVGPGPAVGDRPGLLGRTQRHRRLLPAGGPDLCRARWGPVCAEPGRPQTQRHSRPSQAQVPPRKAVGPL